MEKAPLTRTLAVASILTLLLGPADAARAVDLQVAGLIESLTGFKFPDGSIQTSAGGGAYSNVVVVAQTGGHFTSIQQAIDSITGESSTNRFLVWIAPGTYDENIVMDSYVYLRGAGRDLTKIQPAAPASSCVTAAGDSGLSDLSVVCKRANGQLSIGVLIASLSDFKLSGVSIEAEAGNDGSTGTTRGVFIQDSIGVRLVDVFARGRAGEENVGVYGFNVDGGTSSIRLERVEARGSFGERNWGIYLEKSWLLPSVDVTAEASAETTATGVEIKDHMAEFHHLTSQATSAGVDIAVEVDGAATVLIRDSDLYSEDATGAYGIATQGTGATVEVFGTRIEAADNTVLTVAGTTVNLVRCHLDGGAVGGGGTEVCRFSTDESFTATSVTCP